MGRGFGRGAKSVAIVTHAQSGGAGKKTPKGLRGNRQRKLAKRQNRTTEQGELEKSLGVGAQEKGTPKSLAQQIATINFPLQVNRRQKGFKQLRKQILHSVKDLRRRRSEKGRQVNERKIRQHKRRESE